MAYFADRIEAGKRLASALADFAGKNAIVLAIPRGGVVVGYENRQSAQPSFGRYYST